MERQPIATAPKDAAVIATWPDGSEGPSRWCSPAPEYRPHWTRDGVATEDEPVSWRSA